VTPADAARARRLDRIRDVLVCPRCRGSLDFAAAVATCIACSVPYPIRNGRIHFIEVPARDDEFDRLKGWLKKRLGRAYYTVGVRILAPTFPFNFGRRIRRHIDPAKAIVIDAGSGNNRVHPEIICADMFDYEAVDVVCRLDALPFRTEGVDAFVSRSVLEHVDAPELVLSEFERCTRPGGIGIHIMPFLFPYHASPTDYHRLTHEGQALLFKGWRTLERTNPTGPVTAMLVLLIEVLSTILSFNLPRVKSVVYLLLCGLLFPVKCLDAPFIDRAAFLGSAASILSVVSKPAPGPSGRAHISA
jgi:SAM-dependent methyltransferase/uncharacterized protein YbaR (Trm112 family)